MKQFEIILPGVRRFRFKCERIVIKRVGDMMHHIPINPVLPANFDDTPNEIRPIRSLAWWGVPFIRTHACLDENRRAEWLKHWPEGVRYDVRCLDGGAWDRSTVWGMFSTLEQAIARIIQ